MPTYTTNYNLAKPLVNSAVDQDLWGDELNDDMDIIDTTMKTISDSVVPLSTIYPVGTLYWNKTDSTNPGTLFGFGTWVAITDKFIVARGGTYTGTGGAATVTLSVGNLPPHTHSITGNTGGSGSEPESGGGSGTISLGNTGSTGSGDPFSIIPPYQAAYCWERTA